MLKLRGSNYPLSEADVVVRLHPDGKYTIVKDRNGNVGKVDVDIYGDEVKERTT